MAAHARVRDPGRLAPLFEDRDQLRAVVDSVLEGRLGCAWSDPSGSPSAARLDLGCYAVLGGDPASSAARELTAAVDAPRELAFPDSDAWRELLRAVHGPSLGDRSMRSFGAADADRLRLGELAARVPAGFSIARVGADIARRLGPELQPHAMQVFDDPADFAERGVGFFATDGAAVACVATSYAISSGSIELSIATHPGLRRRGLATAVAARLTLHCLKRGILPHWNPGGERRRWRRAASIG